MLTSGSTLGPYEIVCSLGAGGMGEVYRAIDRRLNRAVAVKVIADRWRDRPDLRERFKIEAVAIAALNHPHITHIYDVGEHDGTDYFVMVQLDATPTPRQLELVQNWFLQAPAGR